MKKKFERFFINGQGKDFLTNEEVNTDRGLEAKWKNELRWAREDLIIKHGFLEKNSQRGVWELSKKGKQIAINLPHDINLLYGEDAPFLPLRMKILKKHLLRIKKLVEQGVCDSVILDDMCALLEVDRNILNELEE